MSNSRRLRLRDVRTVFRLLGEIRELGADPLVWRQHMLESFDQIIGMQVGMSGEALYPEEAPVTQRETFVDVGASGIRDFAVLGPYVTSPEVSRCPVFCTISRWRPGAHTRNYSQGWIDPPFDQRTWSRSAVMERIHAAGIEGILYSQHALPGARGVHGFALFRQPGEKPFSDGQTRLIHLFHKELARLWRLPVADELTRLAPRLRQTLDGLRAGQGEKQVACELGISRHTVHTYVKELHRRFEVASTGELLAHCAGKARYDFFPRLSMGAVPCRGAGH